MATSHVLLKWFACKIREEKKTYFYSQEEKGKKSFKAQNKILKAQRDLFCGHVGCSSTSPHQVGGRLQSFGPVVASSSSLMADGTNHSDSIP